MNFKLTLNQTKEIFPHLQKYTPIYVCDPGNPSHASLPFTHPTFLRAIHKVYTLGSHYANSFVFFSLFSWQGYEDCIHTVTVFSPFVLFKGDLHCI